MPFVSLTLSCLARAIILFLYKNGVSADRKGLPFGGRDVLGNLAAVSSVVHEQQFHVLLIADQELSEAVGEDVSGLLFLLRANGGHADGTTELSPD